MGLLWTGHIEAATLLSPMTQITSGLVLLNSNAPLGHMDGKKHEHLKQMHVQLKEKKTRHPIYRQQQELVSWPLQVGSPFVTSKPKRTEFGVSCTSGEC